MHAANETTETCLGRLQTQLEKTYEVTIPHAVADFVFHSDSGLRFEPGQAGAQAQEKVVIVERPEDGTVDLGLYLDEVVLKALNADDPTECLHAGNLEVFLTVLEGVSHFVYLVWNAGHARPVSLMELELQAEVDKFVTASTLFARQRGGVPARLGAHLFDNAEFDETLSEESRFRYEKANDYAGRYCRQLEQRYLRNRANGGLVNELRRFYRLTRAQKLRHIDGRSDATRH